MKMSCKELFEIFYKIGGEFVCNYKENTGTLLPQNIKCKNLIDAADNLDEFMMEAAYVHSRVFTETKLLPGEKVEKIHHYQNMSLKEVSIKIYRDEDGYICPGSR